MLRGFRQAGADVVVVDGFGRQRAASMRSIARAAARGDRFDIVYGEHTTMPTILADPGHLPVRPLADARFLRALRRHGTRVGMFYRDVQWRFEPYRQRTAPAKRYPALVAYRLEVAALRHLVDALFLPSRDMAEYLPGWAGDPRVVPLPPGSDRLDLPWSPTRGRLALLYVGGVRPPVYDLRPLLDAVVANSRTSLTVCCPASESAELAAWSGCDRIVVVHEHGEELAARYQACDVSCLVYPPDPYRGFAMPIKLFESVGAGRPILAADNDMAGRFVAEHGLGWAGPLDELAGTVARLERDSTEIARVRAAVLAQQAEHTWQARAEAVAEHLLTGPKATR
jgi:glycosyltransferase involved in cell wall biosynthesis